MIILKENENKTNNKKVRAQQIANFFNVNVTEKHYHYSCSAKIRENLTIPKMLLVNFYAFDVNVIVLIETVCDENDLSDSIYVNHVMHELCCDFDYRHCVITSYLGNEC